MAMIGVEVRNPKRGRSGDVIGMDDWGRVSTDIFVLILASVPDPRIEQGVGDVDQEIDDDIDQRGQQDHRLYHRIVAR
ncbi:hypothetical protein ACVIW3_000823 [Bradyrhizobium diazoefficiens]